MRMVYTSAPDDVFYPARNRLVRRFDRWARRRGRPVDAFAVEALVDHRWEDGDGLLGRWRPEDLDEALCDWFPRKVTMQPGEWDRVVPAVRAFVDFLFDEDLADARCADQGALHAALDKLAGDFATAMGDEARYGLAKFWTMRMLRDGVDPTDQVAANRFIAEVQAGRIAVDEQLLQQVMDNYLLGGTDQPPPLPLTVVPDDDALRALAAESIVVRRLRQIAEWAGDGRALTATGRLKLSDARELVALLETGDEIDPAIGDRVFKTQSSDELYGLSVLVAWARAARVVRVVKGRLVRVKSASKPLADPLALARRAFVGLFELGEAVCGAGYAESLLRWRFDEAVFAVAMALFNAQEALPRRDLRQLTYDIVCDAMMLDPDEGPHADIWRRLADNDVDRLIKQLENLGAVAVSARDVALTPLGAGMVAGHLRELGASVPTVGDLLDETAEVVVATATNAGPEAGAELMRAWCEHNAGTAKADLRALADRTDDKAHRRLATAYMKGC
jgi:hypothetical protein